MATGLVLRSLWPMPMFAGVVAVWAWERAGVWQGPKSPATGFVCPSTSKRFGPISKQPLWARTFRTETCRASERCDLASDLSKTLVAHAGGVFLVTCEQFVSKLPLQGQRLLRD